MNKFTKKKTRSAFPFFPHVASSTDEWISLYGKKTATQTTGWTRVDLQSHTKRTNQSIEMAVCKSDVENRKDPVVQVGDWQKRPAAATMGEGRDVLGVASFSALQQCSCTVRGGFFALPDSFAVC